MLMKFLRDHSFKGKHRLAKWLYPNLGECIVPYANQYLIGINVSEHQGGVIFWDQKYESETSWIIKRFLHTPDSVAVDIGANIGSFTLMLAEVASKVHSVEPHPDFRKRLDRNIRLNNLKNVEVHPLAISSAEGARILYSPPQHMMNKSASLTDSNPALEEKIEVQAITLEKFLAGFNRLDFLKIDADGSDADIILSGLIELSRLRPVIYFEDNGGWKGSKEDLINAEFLDDKYEICFTKLAEMGYQLFLVLDGYLVPTKRIRGTLNMYLAIPI
ncbi:FkbM family methyltransferase [Polynucleobacter duraquae]|nr:FkbM family methyltransferase [Polynucleobacter duraquae]